MTADARTRPTDGHDEHVDTIVVGAGQAGLSVGYHLARRGRDFVILDAGRRIGDAWRARWDSLRLFTPARFDGLDGMPFPAPAWTFPTKDEMADYLEAYAARFELPVRTSTRVERVTSDGGRYVVATSRGRLVADNLVVALSSFQDPWTPPFAAGLAPDIVQLHSAAYRNPGQLRDGPVLLAGAGNSASEIARELAPGHQVTMAGRDTGHIPFRIEGRIARLGAVRLVLRVVFRQVLHIRTPIGRKVRASGLGHGGPLVRVKPKDLAAAGVERAGRVVGVEGGRPVLADGRVLDVANLVWCTGYRASFPWIDLPIHGELEPRHEGGIVPDHPGLYFVGLWFLRSMSSEMIHGVGRDARHIVDHLCARAPATATAAASGARAQLRSAG